MRERGVFAGHIPLRRNNLAASGRAILRIALLKSTQELLPFAVIQAPETERFPAP